MVRKAHLEAAKWRLFRFTFIMLHHKTLHMGQALLTQVYLHFIILRSSAALVTAVSSGVCDRIHRTDLKLYKRFSFTHIILQTSPISMNQDKFIVNTNKDI